MQGRAAPIGPAPLQVGRNRFVLLFPVLAFLLIAGARAQIAVPPLTSRVTDLTNTLTADQRAGLEQKLAAFEAAKGSQIAVLLVPTTQPEAIEQYSIRVAEQWKLGRKGVDDGVLLLVAKNDRKMRLEVGRGLEGAIPDAIAKRIVSDVIAPRFKEGDFHGGIIAGVDRIVGAIEGEPLPAPKVQQARDSGADATKLTRQDARDSRDAGSASNVDLGAIKFVILVFFLFGVAIVALIFLPDSGTRPTGLDSGSAYLVGSSRGGEASMTKSGDSTNHNSTSPDAVATRVKWAGIAGACVWILEWYVSGEGVLSFILGTVVFVVIAIGASQFKVEGIAGASVVILGWLFGSGGEKWIVIGLIVFFAIMIYRLLRGGSWGGDGGSWGGGGGGSDSGGFFGGGGLFGGGGASGDWGD